MLPPVAPISGQYDLVVRDRPGPPPKYLRKSFPSHRPWCNNGGPRIALAKLKDSGGPGMWIEKLSDGVVQVQTPIGPRYVMPSFLQRVYFLWMFRHFPILPHAVLSHGQQRMIDRLCSEQRFVSMAYADGMDDAPVIGTVERRPKMGLESLPPRRPVISETSAGLPAEVRQRS
jgi:hypothetical protein